MTRKGRRLTLIGITLAILSVSVGLALYAVRDAILFFYSPTDLVQKNIADGVRVRLGGLIEQGSVERGAGLAVEFRITDMSRSVPVRYEGILPDLFREGQGVIVEGRLGRAGVFLADTVLAKHDETYMPPEVAASLKKQGVWKGDMGAEKGR